MTLSSARLSVASDAVRNSALADALRDLREKSRVALAPRGAVRRIEVEFAGAQPLAFLAAQRPGARAYVRSRDGVISIAAVGTACSFASVDNPEFTALRSAEPRLVAIVSQRFDAGRAASGEWRSFGAATVRVPAIELRHESTRTTLAANFVGDGAATRAALDRVAGDEQPTDPHPHLLEFSPGFGADGGVNSSLDEWRRAVETTLRRIDVGEVRKIVLARTRTFELAEPIDPCELLLRLGENEPGTYQFFVEEAPGTAFVGASPERLFRRADDRLESEAVAGTRPRGETPEEDRALAEGLIASAKDRHEHQLVLDQICEKLAPVVASLRSARYPQLLRLANVQHLCSPVEAELRAGVTDGELLARLHPTPAVCGQPVERARAIIREAEPFDRGLYAGPVGIVGAVTDVCVAIRSALLQRASVTAFAGAGIVAGSNADGEWRETEDKLATFERVVRRSMSVLDAENVNYLWAGLLFEEWKRQGLKHVIVCPGSRSSPLAIEAARTKEIEVVVVADERCAGFIALGVAKASGTPAAVVTTSGTAVANLLPAVVEASMRGTPMLLATADRPPELRGCGANQSIPQSAIFGTFARWSFEIGCPSIDVDVAYVLSTADEAWARSTAGSLGGPVHLNCPFREPLAPTRATLPTPSARVQAWWSDSRPWRAELLPQWSSGGSLTIPSDFGPRRLVVFGECRGAIAHRDGNPVMADVTLRHGTTEERFIDAADLVLAALDDPRCAGLRTRLQPDAVFRFGGPIASKRVNSFIAKCPQFIVSRDANTRFDDAHTATHVVSTMIADVVGMLGSESGEFGALWRRVGDTALAASQRELARNGPLTEPWIAGELPRRMPAGPLVVGNSMSIRDVDTFWPSDAKATRVIANRGASGIDGLVSTAVGVAISGGSPTTLLLGDLALLHDLGGLANIRHAKVPLHIVVINNDGGGIFHFLPIASDASFEKLFGTPHGLSFEHAAKMFGLEYRRAATKADATSAFAALTTSTKPLLIELITDRATNVEAHRSIQRAVADALAKEFA